MAQSHETEAANRYVSLDYLRAAAAWLVAWDHLANTMPGWRGQVFLPALWVRNHISGPLGVIQDFGWFGVALFFLISGFIISDRARVESAGEFVLKRLLRIYPMLAVAVLLSSAFAVAKSQVTVTNVLLNLTLANYLVVPQVALLGVAWTLVIEMMFYALTAVTQFARNSPHSIALNLAVVALMIWRRGAYGPSFLLAAAVASYLPVLVMGQTIYWWLAKGRLSAFWGLTYLAAAYGLFMLGLEALQPGFLPVTNSYVISVTYALLLFVVLLRASLRPRPVVRLLSDTSYSLYLLHGVVGWGVMAALLGRAPLWVAIALAAGASLAASCVTYWLIETPANTLARRLSRSRRHSAARLAEA
ncbi:acyltransferase [Phenylobacterium sp.]|jgi:peptidoglycan/LPS O-acetylase OafA/YrhL|uniref:acyltransferase family protein n=1 Tax=Phenylobacterium sp. TaxID=1871053 RepID=UPI002F3F2999